MKALLIGLTVLLISLQYRLWFGDASIPEMRQYQHRIKELRAEAESLRQRNQALEAEVQDLKTGMEAIEERARRDLGMIGENQTYFQIIDKTKQ